VSCVEGNIETKRTIVFVQGSLTKFNLNLDRDNVGTITDRASDMMKFGQDSSTLHITCLTHATHLTIFDILQRKIY